MERLHQCSGAEKAVDGQKAQITDPADDVYGNGSVMQVASEIGTNVWWQVDLGADHVVSGMKLYNRYEALQRGDCAWRILSKNFNGGVVCSSEDSGPGFTLGVSKPRARWGGAG